MAEVIAHVDDLNRWAHEVKAYAATPAINHGKSWPGFKLVKGRSIRHYRDETKIAKTLQAAGYSDIYLKKLLPITKLESFNKAPFQDFVQQIVVNGPNNVVFKLKCGLRLTEKLTKVAGLDENFYRGVIRQRFNEPIRQAEYLYSIIESEGDLIG